jgi:protocatechuate 3,4-dioxygenase beta subunit
VTSRDRTARELDPPLDSPAYRSTALRAPKQPPLRIAAGRLERIGPSFRALALRDGEHDLTRSLAGEPIGERIIVAGRVVDGDGRAIPRTLVEIWQANASGRYAHEGDRHEAPLDPAFRGGGRCLTDDDGRYRFVTIKPGAYPWRNHPNAWRPAHIHFSLFGNAFSQRLITQMYFPGDPLLAHDPIFQAVPGAGQSLLIASFDLDLAVPEQALGYRWDIALRGPAATPMET